MGVDKVIKWRMLAGRPAFLGRGVSVHTFVGAFGHLEVLSWGIVFDALGQKLPAEGVQELGRGQKKNRLK